VFGSSSANSIGVLGQAGDAGPTPVEIAFLGGGAGVFGSSLTAGVVGTSIVYGIYGFCGDSAANGLFGFGVFGRANSNIGVGGGSDTSTGVLGRSGVDGPDVPSTQRAAAGVAGVFGTSDQKAGVVGTSNASYGVYGFSKIVGVVGEADPSQPNAYAGSFNGKVVINGDFTVMGALKGCAVPFPDGTHRTLYCMESPEVWFEDFGAAKLDGGRAVVKLDADFAKVIKRGDYRVFLTAEGDCRGLYVRRKIAASFEVRELMGGKSSIAFSYRIVGRRKDVRSQKRFPKLDIPPPMRPAARRGRTRSPLGALLATLRKQAGARPRRARRRKTARAPQPLPTLLAKLRKQAGAKAARQRKRRKKRA
jgi:hypothetical protein